MPETRMENEDIVVIIPGLTSSVLQKDGKDIWAVSGQTIWSVLSTIEDSLQQLKLKSNDNPEAHQIQLFTVTTGSGKNAAYGSK